MAWDAFLVYYVHEMESFQLYRGLLNICAHCRPKWIPWNEEDVLLPSIHSGVENDSPTNLYNKSFISSHPCIPPSLSVVHTNLPFGKTPDLQTRNLHFLPFFPLGSATFPCLHPVLTVQL